MERFVEYAKGLTAKVRDRSAENAKENLVWGDRTLSRSYRPGDPDLLQRPVNDRLQFPRVLDLTPFGENLFGFFGSEPGRVAHRLVGFSILLYFQQKGFDDKFLHSGRLPKNALRMDIEMEMPRLDAAPNPGLFPCLAFRRLTMR